MRRPDADLTNCDREPIHIPGSIQPHGGLLACDSGLTHLNRHSENLADILGLDPEEPLIARSIEDLFGGAAAHTLRNALAASNASRHPSLLFAMDLLGRKFDVAVHRTGEETIVEFEPLAASPGQPLDIARTVIARIGRARTVEALVTDTTRLIRAVLGYDRVMMYRFEEDGSGQVIGEAKNTHLESFMGQYFPASDIPQQARLLYLQNTIRVISDAACIRVPIVPELDGAGQPLDLSHAHLRSVSPVHCEYLRNMGVGASMSISIIIDGTLWGLIACHHYSPKHLTMSERVAVEMFGEFLSLHLDVIRQKRKMNVAHAARQTLDRFLHEAPRYEDTLDLLRRSLPQFAEMLPCDGIGLWINGVWTVEGVTPPDMEIAALADFVGSVAEGRIWSSHMLGGDYPRASAYSSEASGLLAIPLTQRPKDYLFFFRREFEHTLNWAGDPNKSYDIGPLGDRLTPRKSFAIWKETVKGQSRRWTDADFETAEAIRAGLVEIVLRHNEIINEERGKADLRQRMLNEELNHRVKNILAVIKSLVSQPNPAGRTLGEYLSTLRGRVDALAIAHDQIVRGEGGGLLRDLLRAELNPYNDQTPSIRLQGPRIWIDTTAFSVLALVFHELATNSAKYGALSRLTGQLSITWTLTDSGDCELVWQETGGPQVSPPSRKGFGTILVSRSIPHDLGGRSEIDYRPEGVRARFLIPAKHVAPAEGGRAADMAGTEPGHTPTGGQMALDDISVLLVEDQMLIAMDAELMLSEEGLTNVVTVSSNAEAIARLQSFEPSVAVLDVNLGSSTSLPVAQELRRRGTPFLFATGYGDGSIIPEEFADVSVVRKPYSGKQLVPAILDLLGPRS